MSTQRAKIDTTPQTRVVNNVPVLFYSPHQIEEIIPVEVRIPHSKGSNFDISGGMLHKQNKSSSVDREIN